MTVEFLDSLCGLRGLGERDEGESPRPSGGTVRGDEDLDDIADLPKELFELGLSRFEIEIPDEYLGADGDLLSVCTSRAQSRLGHVLTRGAVRYGVCQFILPQPYRGRTGGSSRCRGRSSRATVVDRFYRFFLPHGTAGETKVRS